MSKPKRGLRIDPDGTVADVMIDGLKAMQAAVGGYIEPITLPDGTMYVNEEGRLRSGEFNPVASKLYGGTLVGSVLLLGNGDAHGNDTHITKSLYTRATNTAAAFRSAWAQV